MSEQVMLYEGHSFSSLVAIKCQWNHLPATGETPKETLANGRALQRDVACVSHNTQTLDRDRHCVARFGGFMRRLRTRGLCCITMAAS